MTKKLYIIIAAITIILSGCTEPIDLKTNDSQPVVVIYGELTDDFKHQEIRISLSSPYFDNKPNAEISGAEVLVQSSEGEIFEFAESSNIQGLYLSNERFRVQGGVSYDLSVIVDSKEYTASTTVSSAIPADSLSFESVEFFGHKNYLLFMHWQDTPEQNCYLFNVIYNDSLLTHKVSKYVTTENTLFEGQYVKGNLYFFDDEANRETDSPEDQKKTVYLQSGDIIVVETSRIPKGFSDFIVQCQKEMQGENPMFGGPASNITTNISNGGVGYFVAYCKSRVSVEFERGEN